MAAPLWSNHVSETSYWSISSHGKNTIINPAERRPHWHVVTPVVGKCQSIELWCHLVRCSLKILRQTTQERTFQLCSSTYGRQDACTRQSFQGAIEVQRDEHFKGCLWITLSARLTSWKQQNVDVSLCRDNTIPASSADSSQSKEGRARESLRTAELFCHQVAKHVYAGFLWRHIITRCDKHLHENLI